MLSRRSVAKVTDSGMLKTQRRFDHHRWYGHAMELDLHQYRFTGERPAWMKVQPRTAEEAKAVRELLPKIDFATTYELLLFDADRLNEHLCRKEFGNEMKFRLEKQANTVARSQALIKQGTYTDPKVEDSMIARIADEEHIQAEMKYVKCIRANETAEDNRLDILPGGSANSLREKTRWNLNYELHPMDRSEIGARLTAWLPEKYHIVYYDDFQTVAALDEAARTQMKSIVANVNEELKGEAKANGWEKDLAEEIAELEGDIDPSRHITAEAIKSCSSLDTLEEWSHIVHEYNGDARMFQIYRRATELTKNADHAKLLDDIETQWKNASKW